MSNVWYFLSPSDFEDILTFSLSGTASDSDWTIWDRCWRLHLWSLSPYVWLSTRICKSTITLPALYLQIGKIQAKIYLDDKILTNQLSTRVSSWHFLTISAIVVHNFFTLFNLEVDFRELYPLFEYAKDKFSRYLILIISMLTSFEPVLFIVLET